MCVGEAEGTVPRMMADVVAGRLQPLGYRARHRAYGTFDEAARLAGAPSTSRAPS